MKKNMEKFRKRRVTAIIDALWGAQPKVKIVKKVSVLRLVESKYAKTLLQNCKTSIYKHKNNLFFRLNLVGTEIVFAKINLKSNFFHYF